MAIDSQQKRMSVVGVGRPFLRSVFPVATPTVNWRMGVGQIYAGNPVAELVVAVATGLVPMAASYQSQPALAASYQSQVALAAGYDQSVPMAAGYEQSPEFAAGFDTSVPLEAEHG